MGNTINVNYMTTMMNQFSKSVLMKSSVGGMATMSDAIEKVSAERVSELDETVAVKTISKDDMTMEEYKEYIYNQISKFRIDPSRSGDWYSINISDEGFETMKNDPEYEEWVLDYIQRDMSYPAPAWYTAMGGPSAYCILNFGASPEERTGSMFSAGYKGGQGTGIFDSHADNSFWSKRTETKKQIKKLTEERIRHQEMMEELDRKRLDVELLARRSMPKITSGMAIESYESSFMVSNASEGAIEGEMYAG